MCFPCCWPYADLLLEDPAKEKKKNDEQKVKVIWVPYGSDHYAYGYYVPVQHGQAMTYSTWKAATTAAEHAAKDSSMHTYHYTPPADEFKPVQSSPTPPAYPYYAYLQYPATYAYYPLYQYYASPQTAQQYAYYYPYAAAAAAAPAAAPVASSGKHHYWYGRTKEQVDEDNMKVAVSEAVFSPTNMEPSNPGNDQQFWVVELDGSHTLRNFDTIKNDLQPGVWARDPRYGNAYFIRKKKD